MQVVIVESPAKAKTINKYLGKDFKVLASYGHVRDLPAKDGSVVPDEDFSMSWAVDRDSSKRLNEIAAAVKDSDELILATDPDREGEAISWHVLEVLKKKKALKDKPVKRVVFNEITKSAVQTAMAQPRDLNDELIDAYLARRALDYLVGFTLSPVLWRKLPSARSAGRVQSVALRLIVDREMEIEAFKPQEYWSILAKAKTETGEPFEARLTQLHGEKITKFSLANEASATAAKQAVEAADFTLTSLEAKPIKRNPAPPFTTSTLQQEAARKLGFSASRTMQVAQKLYEGVAIGGETSGLITYMRTDGVQMAQEAIGAARAAIGQRFGDQFLPEKPRHYATKAKNAQEAHEAIRPTSFDRHPKEVASYLNDDQKRLYKLIWDRAIASQMATAILLRTTADFTSTDGKHGLRATGQVIDFPGFMQLYLEGKDDSAEDDDARLPAMQEGMRPQVDAVDANQHFTEPPPRFSEASLVKKLEELGIGRPSTYASTLQTLRDRQYVVMDKNRFFPEDKGRLVTAFLEKFFERYVEYGFTADLEEQLDKVSAGEADWKEVLRAFWQDFKPKTEEVLSQRTTTILDALNEYLGPYLFQAATEGGDPRQCPACTGGQLSLKIGRYGAFVGCSNYPECNYTRQFSGEDDKEKAALSNEPKELGPDPETGDMITLRSGRFGPFVQLGEQGEDKKVKPKRSSIPKDMDPATLSLSDAINLLSLPRLVGTHPETSEDITATIGRYGPYLAHADKTAKLASTEDVLTIGLNRAVALLADSKNSGRPTATVLKELGDHPDGGTIQLLKGRYGPYIKHGKINASLAKTDDPDALTVERALELIEAKAAKGGKKKAPAKRKTVAKKKAS
ncbi:MAG: type I DNA topoisomerase [Pseudomonadota bacterium]